MAIHMYLTTPKTAFWENPEDIKGEKYEYLGSIPEEKIMFAKNIPSVTSHLVKYITPFDNVVFNHKQTKQLAIELKKLHAQNYIPEDVYLLIMNASKKVNGDNLLLKFEID